MRYIVQFVIPALLLALLIYVVARKKRAHNSTTDKSESPIMTNTTFVLCLVVGSGLTVGLLFGISAL